MNTVNGRNGTNRRRVVITGLGVVAPNGIGKDEFWSALVTGRSGIRQLSGDCPNPNCHVVGQATDFDPLIHVGPQRQRAVRRMSRISQFAVACAEMAVADSAIDLAALDPGRIGVCFGTTTGKPDFDKQVSSFLARGVDGLDAIAWAEFPPHAPTSHVAKEIGVSGPTFTCSGGCCTGLMVVEWGATQIAGNVVDAVIVGSGDSLLSPLLIGGLSAGDLLTTEVNPAKACRPYDLHRSGLVPSEAAGVILLESLESAVGRKAHIYAEYLGYSSAAGNTAPRARDGDGEGLALAITTALRRSNLKPDEIDCINSHGLSHRVFDAIETEGLKLALGKAAYQIPITSIKSMTGASFSGDGILQVISSCMILQNGVIPPTINLETPDPDCDLDYVPNKPRVARVRHVLTNTRAIGGTNAALIIGQGNS